MQWAFLSHSAPTKEVPCEGERGKCLQCYRQHAQARHTLHPYLRPATAIAALIHKQGIGSQRGVFGRAWQAGLALLRLVYGTCTAWLHRAA